MLAEGDSVRIALEGSVVNYYHNGALVYTSSSAPAYPLLFDASISTFGGRLAAATICANNLGAAPTATSTPSPTATGTNTPRPLSTATPTRTATPAPTPRYLYGLVGQGRLGDVLDLPLLQSQYNVGVRGRLVQLGWDVIQPSGPTSLSNWAIQAFQQRIDAFVNQGPDVKIYLDLGLQFPPNWVKTIDPLVDQYGSTWQPDCCRGGINVYWSPTVRQHVANYLQKVFTSLNFRGRLWAVRVGVYTGELMYPERNNPTQNVSFWAFDPTAQAQSPAPGWRPGEPSPNGEAQRFYYWYVDNLANTFNFFLTEIRRYYSGYVAPVTPGTGIWSGSAQQLIGRNLHDSTLCCYGTGNYWERIFAAIPRSDPNVLHWCSSMGDISGWNESGPNWWEWSSTKQIAHLARLNGRQVYGENSGQNAYDTSGGAHPRTTMQWIFQAMSENGYLGLMWLSQSDMLDPRFPSLQQYGQMVAQYP